MFDFSENTTKTIKKSLLTLNKSGFKYLSTEGNSFLQKISDNLDAALKNKKKLSSVRSENSKYSVDQQWVLILNSKENWTRFKKSKTSKEIKDISILEDFWNSQNQFALNSNESLVNTFDIIIYCLSHVEKAIKEFEKNKQKLSVKFANSYGNFLKNLNERLLKTKNQLINAISLRLKIADSYNNRTIDEIDHCDVVYYISRNLNSRKALNAEEQKILPLNPRCDLCADNQNYYVAFYDRLRSSSASEESNKRADQLHWSRIINKSIFPLTNKVPDFNSVTNNKIYYYGFSFSEIGNKDKTKIAVPTFLNKFAPERYQTPSWFYWQDNMILDFWSKRQEFLANLQCFWSFPENGETRNKANHEKCLLLINDELRKIGEEDPSFFAFTYKEMLKEWSSCLRNLRGQLLSAVKNPVNKRHIQVTQGTSHAISDESNVKKSEKINKTKESIQNKNNEEIQKLDTKINIKQKPVVQKKRVSIPDEIKKNEDEYQKWQSDSSDKFETPVYPDSKNLGNKSYLFAVKEKRLSIKDLDKDSIPVEKFASANKRPSVLEAALRMHR